MTRAKDISKIVTDADLSGTLDVTGAVTTGGNVGINESNPSSSLHIYGSTPKITLEHSNENGTAQIYTQSQSGIILDADPDNTDNGTPIQLKTDGKARLLVEDSGDISFYEDTGTTPKLFWDASAESLGIGTASPSARLTVSELASTTLATFDSTSARMYFGINNTATSYFDCDTLIFRNSPSSGATERMRIDSSGNVGIGESNPVAKTHIQGSGTSGQVTASLILENSSSGTAGMDITGSAGSSRLRFLYGGGPSTGTNTLTEAMNIVLEGSNAGNVGIGTSSPNTKMTVSTGVNSSTRTFLVDNAHSGGSMYNAFGVYVGATDRLVTLSADYGDSIMAFQTNGSERMRINSDGGIGINTTSSTATTGGVSFKPSTLGRAEAYFSQSGTGNANLLLFYSGGALGGRINSNSTSTSYITTSDYRLKENVSYDFDATTRLKQLKPARFNFISNPDTTVDGFLAHEVQSVVPEAISGTHNEVDADGNPVYQGIDPSKLVPLLVKTIQELEARIVALETA
jgi:hypothetical protein